jgi:hypothetical protein
VVTPFFWRKVNAAAAAGGGRSQIALAAACSTIHLNVSAAGAAAIGGAFSRGTISITSHARRNLISAVAAAVADACAATTAHTIALLPGC